MKSSTSKAQNNVRKDLDTARAAQRAIQDGLRKLTEVMPNISHELAALQRDRMRLAVLSTNLMLCGYFRTCPACGEPQGLLAYISDMGRLTVHCDCGFEVEQVDISEELYTIVDRIVRGKESTSEGNI